MSDSEMSQDLDQRISDLTEKLSSLSDDGLYRSEATVCRELRRLAKAEGQLLPYLNGCFHLMNHAGSRLEPEGGAEVAIELIALLENEDHARLIQPDLPDEQYASARAWMTACAYDNLAVATGRMNGFNSDGMHACINEGIQVCRRTGKLQCITCFREYGTHVYMAADDLELAQHFARMGEAHHDPGPHDRRWVGVRDQALIDLHRGDLEGSLAAGLRAWSMVEAYHSPRTARRESRALLTTIALMMGRESELTTLMDATGMPAGEPEFSPPGEDPDLEYMNARNDALRLCVEGKPEAALAILDKYERLFEQRKYLHEWLEVKLRIVAALKLAGREDAAKAQAKILENRATPARDWLTLRRLSRLLDPAIPVTPLALLGNVTTGPYAVTIPAESPVSGEVSEAVEESAELPERSDFQRRAAAFFERLRDAEPEEFPQVGATIQREILAIAPSEITTHNDAAPLLYLLRMLASEDSDLPALWSWASEVAAPHPKDANLINQLATFGTKLITELGVEADAELRPEALAAKFRASLDLDPNDGGNFARAGSFYLAMGDTSEAERCLARSFRLDRSSAYVAKKLADLYSNSGRSRDALAVLDLCLREGCDDADVSWDAAVLATNLQQWEACVSYCDHFEENRPGEPWICYYKANGLLELGRGAEALEAAEEEARRNPEAPFSPQVLVACALSSLGKRDLYREQMGAILDGHLSEVTYLTQRGLARLHELLWKSAQILDRDDPIRKRLDERLLASGLAPNEFFEPSRKGGEVLNDINFYEVILEQPLDESWDESPFRLANEGEWTSYRISWGVLAKDEDQAREIALEWQSRAHPIEADVVSVEMSDDGFRDAVGVVWQGMREGPDDEAEDDAEPQG